MSTASNHNNTETHKNHACGTEKLIADFPKYAQPHLAKYIKMSNGLAAYHASRSGSDRSIKMKD